MDIKGVFNYVFWAECNKTMSELEIDNDIIR